MKYHNFPLLIVFVLIGVGSLTANELEQDIKRIANCVTLQSDLRARDLGVVRPGQDAEFELPLLNTSGKSLKVSSIGVGCACTNASASEDAVEPGQSIRIKGKLRVDSKEIVQKSELIVQMQTLDNRECFEARIQFFARVRSDCHWSMNEGDVVRVFPHEPFAEISAVNYSPNRWGTLRAHCESDLVKLLVTCDEFNIEQSVRQFAKIKVEVTDTSPRKEELYIELLNDRDGASMLVGRLRLQLEVLPLVQIMPSIVSRSLLARKQFFLIINERGATFDDGVKLEAYQSEKSYLVEEQRRISGRWLQVAVPNAQVSTGDLDFRVMVNGRPVVAKLSIVDE